MQCDIVIPAFQNQATLAQSLAALFAQQIPPDWTVATIISDDGSPDRTVEVARRACSSAPWPCRVITNPHAGSAAARNAAIKQSTGDIILFLGADILLRPHAVAAHCDFHSARPQQHEGALGFIKWDPRINPTPLMEWMMHGGPQNDFDRLLGVTEADPTHCFWGSHLSLKRRLVVDTAFAEQFTEYGWEDLELGRRLSKQGFRLHPLHRAVGLHHHFYTARAVVERQRQSGKSAPLYQQLHPKEELIRASQNRRRKHQLIKVSGLLAVLTWLAAILSTTYSTPRLYALVTAAHFWQGVYESLDNNRFSPK